MKKSLIIASLLLLPFLAFAATAYTVQKGDYMFKIAQQKGMTVETLISFNPQIKNPSLIYPGQKINLSTSTVAAGSASTNLSTSSGQATKPSTKSSTKPATTTPPVTNVPTSTPPQAGETRLMAYTTAYTYWDNTPPGSADISNPIIHQKAGGTGTFADPITLAVGHTMASGKDVLDFAAGTKFYIPNLRKYFIVEDTCGDGKTPENGPCHSLTKAPSSAQVWLDMWIDGASMTSAASTKCAETVTDGNGGDVHLVIQNPASNYPVVVGPVINAGLCAQQFGNVVVSI